MWKLLIIVLSLFSLWGPRTSPARRGLASEVTEVGNPSSCLQSLSRVALGTASKKEVWLNTPDVFKSSSELRNFLADSIQEQNALGSSRIWFKLTQTVSEFQTELYSQGFRKSLIQIEGESFFKDLNENHPKTQYFESIAQVLQTHRKEFYDLLTEVETPFGANFELDATIRQLRGVSQFELHSLDNTEQLDQVASYAPTNVPLIALIQLGVIPASVSNNVWFRTPETTRSLYERIFKRLVELLPPKTLENIHLLTDPFDTQYENFRKMYTAGLNKKGNRVMRRPSEVVMFVGNPDTLKRIVDTNGPKMEETRPEGGYKQMIYGWGSGSNPSVLVGSGPKELNRATDLAIETVRMNCRQDCEAANFYLVPKQSAIAFNKMLLDKSNALKLGDLQNPNSDYSHLTMSKKMDHLVEYRTKYEKNLLNKDAVLDLEKKVVTPHLFLFTQAEFAQLDLQEHFAPFFTIVTYDSVEQLNAIARDPRLQRRAQYVSIVSPDTANAETDRAISAFRQNNHAILANASPYEGYFLNGPVGGKGTDVSRVITLEHPQGGSLGTRYSYTPILFSAETQRAFPELKTPPVLSIEDPKKAAVELAKVIELYAHQSDKAPVRQGTALKTPGSLNRERGLEAIRRQIQREGLLLYTTGEKGQNAEYWNGVPLVSSGRVQGQQKGVVLHRSEVGKMNDSFNAVRGSLNPLMPPGRLLDAFENSKWNEWLLVQSIDPNKMPRTDSVGSLMNHQIISKTSQDSIRNLKNQILRLWSTGKSWSDQERQELVSETGKTLETFMSDLRRHYPEGAYIKNYGEFATGDLGTQITTHLTNPKRMAQEFISRLDAVKRGTNTSKLNLMSPQATVEMTKNWSETGSKFMMEFLKDPSKLLVQSKVNIDRTPMGFPHEYRVDFIDGEAVGSRHRFSHEYLPEENAEAIKQLNEFFSKAPIEMRMLPGGADLARLQNGDWIFLEFNFGPSSGTWYAGYYPIESHELISSLTLKPTPMLIDLKKVFDKGLDAQKIYLQKLSKERALWWRTGVQDLSRFDIARHFRNQHLEAWAKSPSLETKDKLLKDLDFLFEDTFSKENEDSYYLKEGARFYMENKLKASRTVSSSK